MASNRESISTPQSSAGILSISANTDLKGIKFDPRGVVLFAAIFIIVVKIADLLTRAKA